MARALIARSRLDRTNVWTGGNVSKLFDTRCLLLGVSEQRQIDSPSEQPLRSALHRLELFGDRLDDSRREKLRYPRIPGELIARFEGDDYVLSGRKSTWVGNGTIATHALTHVTIESKGMASRDILLIPLDLPGISRAEMDVQ
jgi:hypothetical protein